MKTTIPTIANILLRLSPILALLFLFLWLRSCNTASQQVDRYQTNLDDREREIRSYRLSNGQLMQEKELLSVTNKELRNQVWAKDDSLKLLMKKLKDPVVAVQWKTSFVHDTVYIPFDTPTPQPFQRNFNKVDQWYSLSGKVDQDGISIDKILIPNTQRLVVGYKKGKPVVSVTNSNPHLLTEAIEGQVVSVPKKSWVLGVGAIWNIYQAPSAGVFVGYKLLEL